MKPLTFLLSTVLAMLAVAQPGLAQISRPSLESLAAAWSGAASAPECTPETHVWEPKRVIGEVCVWRRSDHTWAPYELGGHRRPGQALSALMWYRDAPDSLNALAFRDSVDQAIAKYALQRHTCPDSTRVWQARGFYMLYSLGARQPSGLVSHSLIVTTEPLQEITTALCPGVQLLAPWEPVRKGKVGAAGGD